MRVLACGTALDPLADLWIHELAGKGDLDPLAKVCHRYTSGLDDEAIAYAAESARLLRNETERRSAMFKKLRGTGLMPDGKVTRELAAKYKELRPLVAIFDEVQNVLTDKQHGDQAAEDLAYVIRVGRALRHHRRTVHAAARREDHPDRDHRPDRVPVLPDGPRPARQ